MGRKVIMRFLLLLTISSLYCQMAFAKDFGKCGVTTAIKEEGFLAMIARKLKSLDLKKEEEKMLGKTKERINTPIEVKGIKKTTKVRSFTFDPTYILLEDIYLPSGELLHPAGTKVNPLDYMDLDRKMIFTDETDKEQVSWLKNQILEFSRIKNFKEEELVIILVAGSPLKLQEEINKKIYFDQNGELTSRFNIKQVPAIAEQEGKLLRISEIDIGGMR